MTDIELTKGQYDALMERTRPNDLQTQRVRELRAVLEGALPLRSNHRYAVELTAEMIETASFVLKVAALKGGALLLASNMFETRHVLEGQTPRERLLKAREAGKEIREAMSYKLVSYRPQGSDSPWAVYEDDLRQWFRVPDEACVVVTPVECVTTR